MCIRLQIRLVLLHSASHNRSAASLRPPPSSTPSDHASDITSFTLILVELDMLLPSPQLRIPSLHHKTTDGSGFCFMIIGFWSGSCLRSGSATDASHRSFIFWLKLQIRS
ncbi:hypothetical protein L2E82_49775 [Cichorium intybus]|uniref:Uncharacterized protein n=1 Tax=Cichorium intybus TaxID=13427 RepID=A0ACB8Z151_CICIN|nr:hypothetical protein L2E82_49775 [Cichorium intybus]